MSQPHIRFHQESAGQSPRQTGSRIVPPFVANARPPVGELLLRTAECLKALMQGPTVDAGLNESRYNVLAVLHRTTSGRCSQTELARELLQSESNLSTLLERMRKDGLISRVPSEIDRRKALIGLTPAGSEALVRAEEARARAAAPIFCALEERCGAALGEALTLLASSLEHVLGVRWRETTRGAAAGADYRNDAADSAAFDEGPGGPAHSRATALIHGESIP
jgi:DNA-binding MarR family transcriptional regulator